MANDPDDREDGLFGREREDVEGDRGGRIHDDEGPEADDLDDLDLGEPTSDAGAGHTALPARVEAWRRRSAAGAILTGFALGLQEALEKRKEEPSIVMETSGDPPKDLPVEADFEYGRPRQSVVQIRPWLLPDGSASTESAEASEDRAASSGDGPPSAAPRPGPDRPEDGEPA